MRKPVYGNIPVMIGDEQIAEMRELYAKIRQIKSGHAYSMLTLADTTKEERAFFAAVGDINNGRSYAEEQAEVDAMADTLVDRGHPVWKTLAVEEYENYLRSGIDSVADKLIEENMEAFLALAQDDLIDPSTGTKLTPSPGGRECLGNGSWVGYECCCDECDFYLECFPEAKMSD